MAKKKGIIRQFMEGLLILLPIALTFYLIYWLFSWVYNKLGFIRNGIIALIPEMQNASLFAEIAVTIAALVLIFLLVLFIGIFGRTVIGRFFGNWIDKLMLNLPGVKSLYKGLKQVLNMLFGKDDNDEKFSKPVLVEYPRRGCWSIAFLTGEAMPAMCPSKDKKYLTVFMPTTPNPTNGFLLIIPEDEVVVLKVPGDLAFKIIISGGLLKDDDKDTLEAQKKIAKEIKKQTEKDPGDD